MELVETFTKEKILYDPVTHHYTTLDGQSMISGSAYAKSMCPDFDADKIAGFVATKQKARKSDILAMWEINGNISRTFGTALHLAMEQWFRFRGLGTAKDYHRTRIKYLQDAVDTFPLRDYDIVPEAVVSDSKTLRCGRLDGIVVHCPAVVSIIDYKTDSNVEKNLDHHALQLNFYRWILEASGLAVKSMDIWAYDGVWSCHKLPRIEIK